MCGRTTLTITPDDLQRTFGFPAPPGYRPRYNIAPSQELLALSDSGEGVTLKPYRWGLVPFWARDPAIGNRMINARSETVDSKPAYRAAFAKRRCLIIVDGFYEWQRTPAGKRPHRIRLRSREPFTLAGIWERWDRGSEPIESCAILTTDANEMMSPIHDRMPVIIAPEARDRWLASDADAAPLIELLAPYPGKDLEAYEVSTLVNSPANDIADCVEPVDPPEPMLPL